MVKKKDVFAELNRILNDGVVSGKWCIVDTENIFVYNDQQFKIPEDCIQYEVRNKPEVLCEDSTPFAVDFYWNDWENEAKMDRILCVENGHGVLTFYDQNAEIVKGVKEMANA